MSKLYVLKIDQPLSESELNRLINHTSKQQQTRLGRLSRPENRQSSLLGILLGRYAVRQKTGLPDKDLVFGTNPYGKPVLLSPGGIHFNISHTKNWVVCAADDYPVGIDVEVIRPVNLKLAKRFFSGNEYDDLLSQPEDLRLRYFFRLWTLKESYVKAEGKGLGISLNSFEISITDSGIHMVSCPAASNYTLYQTFLDDEAVCAVCTQNVYPNNAPPVYRINLDQLLRYFD